MLGRKLTDKKIKEIHAATIKVADSDEAWKNVSPLIKAQASNEAAANALIDIVDKKHLTIDQSLDILSKIFESHQDNDEIVILIGDAMESCRNLDYLNDPPPEHPLFAQLIKRLYGITQTINDESKEAQIVHGLACTARLMARQHDEIAEKSYERLVELLPDKSWTHYNQGLFFKTRGYFSKGVKANQKAIDLADEPCDSYQWNLGICATGSGQGDIALNIWKAIGFKGELGRFDLPEGGYASCKVRLAQRPLSERDAEHDDPGLEETIWIERLSPCHGIIRNVLHQELGVDYGDVILFDGAPITYHTYGDKQIAVFPHLATIRKNGYQIFDFAGTQRFEDELSNISEHLEKDAIIYSHTEKLSVLCSTCWHDTTIDHEHKEREEKHIVTGRIAVPPDVAPKDILDRIDSILKDSPESRLFSPDLCRAAGLQDRATFEERRFNLLISSVE